MEVPSELKRGPRVMREAFNALRLWAISQRPLPSLDCDVHDTPQGRVILPRIGPAGGAPATAAKIFPLKIADASTQADGIRIRIYNGRLGGLLPGEMSLGDNPHYYLNLANGSHFIVGQVSVASNGTFTGASVYNNGTAGLPPANGNAVYLMIGRVVVASSSGQSAIQSISQEAAGNQGLVVFASADGTLLQPMWVPQEIP